MRFGADGIIAIDNNGAERALRQVALERKDYLFAGSDAGGERSAAILQSGRIGKAARHRTAGLLAASLHHEHAHLHGRFVLWAKRPHT